MPRERDDKALPPHLQAMIDSLSLAEVHDLLPRLLGQPAADALDPARRPSRLRSPRSDVVTYRVRVDLAGAKPAIWRRLEIASDMHLEALHEVLQAAMGWSDSHLHGFSSGGVLYDRNAERYLTDFDVEEGEIGPHERDVRLDQVLQEVGDRLHYEYDFGDSWTHVLRLEAIEPRTDDAPPAVCTGGRRRCPPEDVGGIWTYNDLVAALEGRDPEDEVDLETYLEWLPDDFDPAAFSVEEVNAALQVAVMFHGTEHLPRPVSELLTRAGGPGRAVLARLVADARLGDDASPSDEEAERVVRQYTWLLRRVGPDGITLTSAGYLPPAVVAEALHELDLDRTWIGAGNREHHTWPVLELRESAQALGLLRKYKGRLLMTSRGKAVVDDAQALWRHVASRLPAGRDEAERDAGTIVLLLAAGEDDAGCDVGALLQTTLASLGWADLGARSLSVAAARQAASPTWDLLHRLAAVTVSRPDGPTPVSTPEGRLLARAALRSS
ncbi:MAG: plasmid pRiA4b ORF-3 family protein [Actinomycetota bacterium]